MDFLLGKKKDKEKDKEKESGPKEKGEKKRHDDELHKAMQNLVISTGKPTMRDFEKIETVGLLCLSSIFSFALH
jgi:hypothetical protein